MVAEKKKPQKKTIKLKGGRPTKLTKTVEDNIINFIRQGATYTRACLLSGVSQAIFYRWKQLGQKDREAGKTFRNSRYVEFLDNIDQAKAYYIAWLQNSVNKTAHVDGRFALTILERKAKKEFGKTDTVEIEGNIGNVTENKTIIINNTDERMEELFGIIQSIRGRPERSIKENTPSKTE